MLCACCPVMFVSVLLYALVVLLILKYSCEVACLVVLLCSLVLSDMLSVCCCLTCFVCFIVMSCSLLFGYLISLCCCLIVCYFVCFSCNYVCYCYLICSRCAAVYMFCYIAWSLFSYVRSCSLIWSLRADFLILILLCCACWYVLFVRVLFYDLSVLLLICFWYVCDRCSVYVSYCCIVWSRCAACFTYVWLFVRLLFSAVRCCSLLCSLGDGLLICLLCALCVVQLCSLLFAYTLCLCCFHVFFAFCVCIFAMLCSWLVCFRSLCAAVSACLLFGVLICSVMFVVVLFPALGVLRC